MVLQNVLWKYQCFSFSHAFTHSCSHVTTHTHTHTPRTQNSNVIYMQASPFYREVPSVGHCPRVYIITHSLVKGHYIWYFPFVRGREANDDPLDAAALTSHNKRKVTICAGQMVWGDKKKHNVMKIKSSTKLFWYSVKHTGWLNTVDRSTIAINNS